jgi:hypothetical protein
MGIFLLEMTDGSEMILTRPGDPCDPNGGGGVAFEYVDARGHHSPVRQ